MSPPATNLLMLAGGASLVTATAWFSYTNSRKWWWITRLCKKYWLLNVRIPVAVLQDGLNSNAEGLVDCDIHIANGKIKAIRPIQQSSPNWAPSINCQKAIVFPAFVDAHTHLVKTETVPRNRNQTGTITEAKDVREPLDQRNWQRDAFRRMDFAVRCALHYGTRAIRTHLDGTAVGDPKLAAAVYGAYDQIQEKYKDILVIQGVANMYLPLWSDTSFAEAFARLAQTHSNTVLGAYCGNPDPTSSKETEGHLSNIFRIANELNMDVDLHIDESNDPACCVLLPLCSALETARNNHNYKGSVVLGHCCALSLQDTATQQEICQRLGRIGNVFVVANPYTNMGLQDRRGSSQPYSLPIPQDLPRTPQWRGLTLVQELRQAGVTIVAASDNVRDHWYPYGDYDVLAVWREAISMGHLDTAPSEGAWADICTTAAGEAMMGVSNETDTLIGAAADLVVFPNARRISELLARPQVDRIVLRKGSIFHAPLPSFTELDDIM